MPVKQKLDTVRIGNADALLGDPLKLYPPPANDAILVAVGSCLHDCRQFRELNLGSMPPAGKSHKPSGR